jgi:hypothetical protein
MHPIFPGKERYAMIEATVAHSCSHGNFQISSTCARWAFRQYPFVTLSHDFRTLGRCRQGLDWGFGGLSESDIPSPIHRRKGHQKARDQTAALCQTEYVGWPCQDLADG